MALRNVFGALALDSTVQAIGAWLQQRLGAKNVENSIAVNVASDQVLPVSATNLPLPAGAATSTNQAAANTSLSSIDGKTPALVSGRVPVDVGGATLNINGDVVVSNEVEIKNDTGNPVPVSGTVTATGPLTDTQLRASSVPVSAASLPLPSGAATEITLSNIDGKLPALSSGRVPVDVGSSINVGEVEIKNDTGNPVPVNASNLPLPTGAATDATLASINAKLPILDGDSAPITDNGLLAAARESFDTANSTLSGMVLQDDAIPDPSKPSGPALQVTLRDQVQLDPSVAAVTGGIDPTGAVQRTKVGVDGGTQLTDCKQFVGTTQVANGTPTGWIDTTGYQSIVVTFFGSMAATVAFQTTNDTTYSISNAAGYNVNGGQISAVSVTNPGNGITYCFPVTGKFFRVVVSAYTSGIVGAVTTLRAAPFTYGVINQPSINISQVAGVTTASSSASPTGTTSLGVNGAFRAGFQYNTYNALYGPSTQTLTASNLSSSITAVPLQPLTVGGVDGTNASRAILTDNLGAQAITSAPSSQAQQSIQELLHQILATLRASAHYQYETALGDRPRSVGDEPDSLIGDYLNQASQFTNIIN